MPMHSSWLSHSLKTFYHQLLLYSVLSTGFGPFSGLQVFRACIPEVQDNWLQMVWIKQDCKITSGGPVAKHQALDFVVTNFKVDNSVLIQELLLLFWLLWWVFKKVFSIAGFQTWRTLQEGRVPGIQKGFQSIGRR